MTSVTSYSISQKALHWLMAALIFFNLLFTEGMEQWNRLAQQGQEITADVISSANIHAYVGVAVLLLGLLRLALRFTHGAPDAPADEPLAGRIAARAVHATFYALFFILPISGAARYYLDNDTAGFLHGGPFKLLMWILIIVHVAAVLVHQFVWKTEVATRMTKG